LGEDAKTFWSIKGIICRTAQHALRCLIYVLYKPVKILVLGFYRFGWWVLWSRAFKREIWARTAVVSWKLSMRNCECKLL